MKGDAAAPLVREIARLLVFEKYVSRDKDEKVCRDIINYVHLSVCMCFFTKELYIDTSRMVGAHPPPSHYTTTTIDVTRALFDLNDHPITRRRRRRTLSCRWVMRFLCLFPP